MNHNAPDLHIYPVKGTFKQHISVKHCIIPNKSSPMLHTHSVFYQRGSQLRVLLNSAIQRMHKHNCTVHPDNKFGKLTQAVDKTFNGVTKTLFLYKVATKFSCLFYIHPIFIHQLRLQVSTLRSPNSCLTVTSIASVAEFRFVQIATSQAHLPSSTGVRRIVTWL